MKLPKEVPSNQEKMDKKKKILVLSVVLSAVALALVSIVILCVTISRKVKEIGNSGNEATVTQAVSNNNDSGTQTGESLTKGTPSLTLTSAPKKDKPTATPKPNKTNEKKHTPTPTLTPAPTATFTPVPTRGPVVIIDPGHGGNDGGTSGYRSEKKEDGSTWWECDIVLAISLKVRDKLEASGITVIMTRDEDFFPGTPTERVQMASDIDAECLVSIHLNSAPSKEGRDITGTEVWYCDCITPDVKNRLNEMVADDEYASVVNDLLEKRCRLADLIRGEVINKTGSKDRGIKPTDELALTKCTHPSCLVECEFMSADGIFEKLITDEYQNLMADGIVNGIIKYLDWIGVTD